MFSWNSPVEPRYPDHIDQVTAYFVKSRIESLLAKYHGICTTIEMLE
jgi:hypothetical protein